MSLIDILLMVLILSVSSLCIFAIVYLKKILEQVESVCIDIHRLVEYTIPIFNNLEEVTQCANRIVTGVEGYWKEIDHSIIALRRKISNSDSLEKFLDAQTQILELSKNLRAAAKGISAFWRKYKQR